MRGPFCMTTAKNNEEYRRELKVRNVIYAILMLAGIGITVFAYYAYAFMDLAVEEYTLGFYCGAGTGVFVGAGILLIRNCIVMKDEQRLKEARLENSDERNLEINGKAIRVSSFLMVCAAAAFAFIGGIFNAELVKPMTFLIIFFAFSYMAARKYYSGKM